MTSNTRHCASTHQPLSITVPTQGPSGNIEAPTRMSSDPTTTTNSPAAMHIAPDGVLETTLDYHILASGPRHTGLWSLVRFAYPAPSAAPSSSSAGATTAAYTPPATPIKHDGSLAASASGGAGIELSGSTNTNSFASSTSSVTSILSANSADSADSAPPSPVWAIKTPLNPSARTALRTEARTLTRLSRVPGAAARIVSFVGLDPAGGSVVMGALPLTLEDLISGDLAQLAPKRRIKVLGKMFPCLADRLLGGLEWLHDTAGVVHADIKPANILLRPVGGGGEMVARRVREAMEEEEAAEKEGEERSEGKQKRRRFFSLFAARVVDSVAADDNETSFPDLHPLYTDFTSSFPLHPSPPTTNTPTPPTSPSTPHPPPQPFALPLGGGTWDYLAPELCRLHPAPTPSPKSDVYALGITFLVLMLGVSPFEAVAGRNAFRRREMVRLGDAVGFACSSYAASMRGLGQELALLRRRNRDGEADETWALERWLRAGLAKCVEGRWVAGEWRTALRAGLGVKGVGGEEVAVV